MAANKFTSASERAYIPMESPAKFVKINRKLSKWLLSKAQTPVLLMLDNLESNCDLENLLSDLPQGSFVIATSRDRTQINTGSLIIAWMEMKCLSRADATALFRLKSQLATTAKPPQHLQVQYMEPMYELPLIMC
jgi:hypothetical protein